MDVQSILSILATVLGGTNIYTFWLFWKTRKSDIKKTEATALESIDAIYVKMSASTNAKLDEMQATIDKQGDTIKNQSEIIMGQTIKIENLTKSVQAYAKKCANCPIK